MSLEVIVFKKCYKEGEAVIRSNQIVWGITSKDCKVTTNKLLDKILGFFRNGEEKGDLPTVNPNIWMHWKVKSPLTVAEMNARSARLLVS